MLLSPKKIREMRHAPIPAFLAEKFFLLPSHYMSSPAASSPHPLAVSPVYFQLPNCDLDQQPVPKCCDFSVYKGPPQPSLSSTLAAQEVLVATPSSLLSL